MKICKNCVQPDTRPGIFFNDQGICGACLWETKKSKIDWTQRIELLKSIINSAKKSSKSNYDCVIGVSGGKDSTFQAITIRDKFNLNCLLVNYQPEQITEIGSMNIENLKNLGFDVITIRPNPIVMKKLIKHDFYKHLNPVKPTEFPLYAVSYIIAEKFDTPLVIQGENPALTLGISKLGFESGYDALDANKFPTTASGYQEYLVNDISEKDLFFYHYDKQTLEKKGIRGIFLQYFIKEWSQRGNAEFSKKYGLKWREDLDPNSIGNYVPFTALDSNFHQLNQMLKSIKLGFGQCVDSACYDLREGYISRDEAVDLVIKYDGKCSEQYIDQFCKYIGITHDEFWKVANSFRGPMWKKTPNNEWKNQYFEELLKSQN